MKISKKKKSADAPTGREGSKVNLLEGRKPSEQVGFTHVWGYGWWCEGLNFEALTPGREGDTNRGEYQGKGKRNKGRRHEVGE